MCVGRVGNDTTATEYHYIYYTSSPYMLYYCFSLVFNSSAIHFMRVLQ